MENTSIEQQLDQPHTQQSIAQSKIPSTIFGALTEQDLTTNYVPSGYTITMDLPLLKASDRAMLAINPNGFIPSYIDWMNSMLLSNPTLLRTQKLAMQMQPVQVVDQGIQSSLWTVVRITQHVKTLPVLTKYFSFRKISGSIGIGIRISTNTGQTGNLIFTQAAGVIRDWGNIFALPTDSPATWTYQGLSAKNTNLNISNYDPKSFMLLDLSLQRHLSIRTPITRNHKFWDLPNLLWRLHQGLEPAEVLESFQHQYAEDWILMGIVNDLPASTTNQIQMELYFDYSQVEFEMPMLMTPQIGTGQIITWTNFYRSNFVGERRPKDVKLGQQLELENK
nr:putative capsid protein [Polycipiviridae sp.]